MFGRVGLGTRNSLLDFAGDVDQSPGCGSESRKFLLRLTLHHQPVLSRMVHCGPGRDTIIFMHIHKMAPLSCHFVSANHCPVGV